VYYGVAVFRIRRKVEVRLNEELSARKRAEELALQRESDLMIFTHQLLGPLSAIIGQVSGMQQNNLPSRVESSLNDIHEMVEDAITLCYGTCVSLAHSSGRPTAFGLDTIDVPTELRKLSKRMQRINQRADLRFDYHEHEYFPPLQMDRNVFISVIYSIVHNALKYSDPGSTVIMEGKFNAGANEALLRVKSQGEPITSDEREVIFEKFRRGVVVERTGRHHGGVGLGLWVARELMRAVGGDLTVELSSIEPRLSVFVLHFPITKDAAIDAARPIADSRPQIATSS
jgi:Signal transduction histidine kinase